MAVDLIGQNAPKDASYITQTVETGLTGEQALSALATGIVQNTTGTGVLSSITTSAAVASVISDSTGSGALAFATSPALVTPDIGVPSAGTLTSCTGLPAAAVLAGSLGTGAYVMDSSLQVVTIELGAATDTTLARSGAGAITVEGVQVILSGAALGTPSSGVATNLTGTAAGLTAGNVTTNANLTGGVTSVGNAATVITNANLTGGVTSVGNAATVVTNANLTGPITSVGNATTIAASPVLTTPEINDTSSDHQYVFAVSELAADRTVTLPLLLAADTFVFNDHIQTLTNKRVTKRVQSVVSAATVTPSWDNDDFVEITAQAVALNLANPSGTPTEGQTLVIRILDNATGRAITYGAGYRAIGVTLPTTTTASKHIYLGLVWNANDSKDDVIAVSEEA